MSKVDPGSGRFVAPLLLVAVVAGAALISSRLLGSGDGPPERLVFLVPAETDVCAAEVVDEIELTSDEVLVALASDPAFLEEPIDDELALVVVGPDDIDMEEAVRGTDGWKKVRGGREGDVFSPTELVDDLPRSRFIELFVDRCA